jgi:hypothetical protein
MVIYLFSQKYYEEKAEDSEDEYFGNELEPVKTPICMKANILK